MNRLKRVVLMALFFPILPAWHSCCLLHTKILLKNKLHHKSIYNPFYLWKNSTCFINPNNQFKS